MEQGADVNKAATEDFRATPLHLAVNSGYTEIAVCLMERGMADLNVRNNHGRRPYDLAINEAMRQVIVNEEKRRRDHGFKRCVIPITFVMTTMTTMMMMMMMIAVMIVMKMMICK